MKHTYKSLFSFLVLFIVLQNWAYSQDAPGDTTGKKFDTTQRANVVSEAKGDSIHLTATVKKSDSTNLKGDAGAEQNANSTKPKGDAVAERKAESKNQFKRADTLNPYKIISAGPEYKRTSFYQWLWGKNYRKEWTMPVKVPVVLLDTLKGGITPYKAGGGNQTKSLHSRTKTEKEYSFRSVNKTLGKVLPAEFLNTWIEDFVNDKVSMSHPYAAGSVPLLAQSARVYHTNPQYVYLPNQSALDSFNKKFGNTLFLFEQRLDGNWKEADNLGNFEKYTSTDKLLESLYEDNDNEVDQRQYVRSRLFDMFINDWDRHEDQWEWGETKKDDKNIYTPVPQDRDQAYFKPDGVLLKFLISAAGLNYFQSFKNNLANVKTFNYEERNLDRFFANQLTLNDWQSIAKELQAALTDPVIEASVKQLPPEVYPISGGEIISKLKARRAHLTEWATEYYKFIAKEVDVIGSNKKEYFEIDRRDNESTVNIYGTAKEGQRKDKPFYSRVFKSDETEEIRLYGLSGEDTYTINGNDNSDIAIRIIGGNDKDSIVDLSTDGEKIHIYDNADNFFKPGSQTRIHLSKDTSIHDFNYASYTYDKRGIKPSVFFDDDDRLFVGLGYGVTRNKWRKTPFAYKQSLAARYSVSQLAPRFIYTGIFPKAIGQWNLMLLADFDLVKWTNFYGLGNETVLTAPLRDRDFNRMRTQDFLTQVGINRKWGRNNVIVTSFYENVKVIDDKERYLAKTFRSIYPIKYNNNNFAGLQLGYTTHKVNDSIVPTKGFAFFGNTSYNYNFGQSSKSFARFMGDLHLYVPLISKFSLAIRAGAATVTGNPEFYQYVPIGGGQTLRGYRRQRFWGKTAFYSSNTLRFINDVKSYLYNGKAGLVVFFDNGKVWMPSQKSDRFHTGYGAGVLLAPFNKVSADITYSISKEFRLIQLRITKPF